RDRNLNHNLALGGAGFRRTFRGRAFFGLSRAHNYLSSTVAAAESGGKGLACNALFRIAECKDYRRATSNGGGGCPPHQSNGPGFWCDGCLAETGGRDPRGTAAQKRTGF